LTNPDSAAPASENLEVFRVLSELGLLKLLEQLHEQGPAPVLSSTSGALEEVRRGTSFQTSSVADTGNTICLDITPPPGFQPRLILHQESISCFSPCLILCIRELVSPSKDREDRQQWVSAQLCSSVSGFPTLLARRLAAPEPEIQTGYSSQATTSDQSTDLL
jgi:hypothetical protein